jgi:hypothetical protein
MRTLTLEGLHVFDSIEDGNQKPQAGLESGQVLAHALNDLRTQNISEGRGKEDSEQEGNGTHASC